MLMQFEGLWWLPLSMTLCDLCHSEQGREEAGQLAGGAASPAPQKQREASGFISFTAGVDDNQVGHPGGRLMDLCRALQSRDSCADGILT